MTKRFLRSAVCAAALSLCAITVMRAQDAGGGASIPQLPFHLVEGFFHYPANYVMGRASGVAVSPTGTIVGLVSDGTWRRTVARSTGRPASAASITESAAKAGGANVVDADGAHRARL